MATKASLARRASEGNCADSGVYRTISGSKQSARTAALPCSKASEQWCMCVSIRSKSNLGSAGEVTASFADGAEVNGRQLGVAQVMASEHQSTRSGKKTSRSLVSAVPLHDVI